MHCFVSGKVQGVFFRYGTKLKAQKLGLTGWVKNLSDGRVELIACGEKEQVEQLHKWLFKGPIEAHVTNVERKDTALQDHESFESRD